MSIHDTLECPINEDEWLSSLTDLEVTQLAARRMLEAVIDDIEKTRIDEDIEGTSSDWLAKYLVRLYEKELKLVKGE